MAMWDDFYIRYGIIDKEPETHIVDIVPILKSEKALEVLDVGCGTGRNSLYLARQGFRVHGIDISRRAIGCAKAEANKAGLFIDYRVESFDNIIFPPNSIDFIYAVHSLEYDLEETIASTIGRLHMVLKKGKPILVSVDSTEHPFCKVRHNKIDEVSHIAFAINNRIANQFFTKERLMCLFKDYAVKRLEHISRGDENRDVSPIREWVFFGYKK